MRINATGEIILICDECEAVWFSEDDIGRVPWVDFSTHAAKYGLPGLWSEITAQPDEPT